MNNIAPVRCLQITHSRSARQCRTIHKNDEKQRRKHDRERDPLLVDSDILTYSGGRLRPHECGPRATAATIMPPTTTTSICGCGRAYMRTHTSALASSPTPQRSQLKNTRRMRDRHMYMRTPMVACAYASARVTHVPAGFYFHAARTCSVCAWVKCGNVSVWSRAFVSCASHPGRRISILLKRC